MSSQTIDTNLLEGLSEDEKKEVLKIMKEFSTTGKSSSYDELVYADYKEIPVDIETFLTDPNYLGKGLVDSEGRFTVFPYWVETVKKMFDNTSCHYNTLVLTGGIGLGKSFCAVICILYMLYQTMCLKDPNLHYGLQPMDEIWFSMINVTLEAAQGVGWSKLQELVQSSPWFMSHGKVTGKDNLEWQPTGKLKLIYGSNNNKLIGKCLDGDTEILTEEGIRKLKDLVDKNIKVVSIDENGNRVLSDICTVKPTVKTTEEYQIELEDGSVIKCTPNHKFMLKDGSYKEAQYLTEDDELFDDKITYKEFIQNIIESRGQWNIPKGEYLECHHIIPKCLGGEGNARYRGKPAKHENIIWLYAHEHFIAHKLLAREHPENDKLILAWSMMAFPKGKTRRDFEITAEEYEEIRTLQSKALSKKCYFLKNGEPWNKGKTGIYSEETLKRIRAPRPQSRGRHLSAETRLKMSIAQKNIDRSNRIPGTKDKICYTDGINNVYLSSTDVIPENYYKGMTRSDNTSNYIKSWTEERKQKFSEKYSGKNNPNYGNGVKMAGGNNSTAIYIYTFENIDYQCRDDLMVVLKKRWPNISESTIRRIMQNKYGVRTTKKFKYVIDNLTWRLKHEN